MYMRFRFLVVLGILLLGSSWFASGQTINLSLTPYQVADIMPGVGDGTDGANGSQPTPFRNGVIFAANDGVHGNEPWFSDGTASGTFMLADINPGPNSGSFSPGMALNSQFLFKAFDPIHGHELWVTDGTTAGTYMLPEIAPGANSSEGLDNIVGVWNNYLFFSGTTSATGREMYRTDGTAAGTVFLGDLFPGTSSSVGSSIKFITSSNYFFYKGITTTMNAIILCSTNGAPGSAQYLPCFAGNQSQSEDPWFLTVLNDVLYFRGYAPTIGYELWKSDGTPLGTVLYHEFEPGFNPTSSSLNMRSFSDQFGNVRGIFREDGFYNSLYRLDGSPGGPTLLCTVGNVGLIDQVVTSVVFNNDIYFGARDSAGLYGVELWKTNMNPGGTMMVKDIYTGANSSGPQFLGVVNNRVLFIAYNGTYGEELWRSNGTSITTAVVKDISNGTISPLIANSNQLVIAPNKFIFTHEWGFNEPWITNGTTNGTFKLINTTFDFRAEHYCYSDGNIFFMGEQNPDDPEIYVTNGTLASTRLVKDLNAPWPSSPTVNNGFVKSGNKVFFFHLTPASGWELWSIRTSYRQTPVVVLREAADDEVIDPVLYPNPASDYITLRFDELTAQPTEISLLVTDIAGKVVIRKENISSTGDTVHEIDLTSIQSGVYFVQMTALGVNKVVRFVKR